MRTIAHRLTPALPPALLFVLFLGVAFYGLDFGVHWDENRAKFDSVKNSLDHGLFLQSIEEVQGYSYNDGGVNYLLTWAGFAPELTKFALSGPHTREALSAAISPLVYTPKARLRVRTIFAFVSGLSIIWLYLLCRALDRSRWESFLAAALLGLSWEVGYHSRWVAPDAVMMQFAVLAFLCVAIAMKKRSIGWFYAAAIVTGLTVGTKYSGILVLPLVLIGAGYALWNERPSVSYVLKHVVGLGAITVLTFIITTPGSVLDPFRFLEQVVEQQHSQAQGFFGYTVASGFSHAWQLLKYLSLQGFSHYWAISILFAIFCLLGVVAMFREIRVMTLLILAFCAICLYLFSQPAAMFARSVLAVIPFLCLAAARGVCAISRRLPAGGERVAYAFIGILLAVNLGWAAYAAQQIGNRADLDYFLRKFEEYAKASPNDTFLVSNELWVSLNKLPDPLPENLTTQPSASFTRAAFLQSESADRFSLKWPANRWGSYPKTFGALEVNLEAYPTFVGNERILVVSREYLASLPVTAEYLATPRLTIDKPEVIAGKDFYTVKIKDLPKSNVFWRYSYNGSPSVEAVQAFDDKGEARIAVSALVPKGAYRILAYRQDTESLWHNVDATVVVK